MVRVARSLSTCLLLADHPAPGLEAMTAWYHEHVREHDPKALPAAGVAVLRPEPAVTAGPSSRAA
jgi:hypothetical protein